MMAGNLGVDGGSLFRELLQPPSLYEKIEVTGKNRTDLLFQGCEDAIC